MNLVLENRCRLTNRCCQNVPVVKSNGSAHIQTLLLIPMLRVLELRPHRQAFQTHGFTLSVVDAALQAGLHCSRGSADPGKEQTQQAGGGLTDAGGDGGAPRLGVLARGRLLALQAESSAAEKLTARVEVGAVGALVPAVNRHVQFGTADLCRETGVNAE